ncbi:tetranectin-like protein [Neodiprion pinetum]|uniref:tetranectin-like protein n=1 Tax=Neodiprion pinetum TaxID=441929 RepID=UPI001EDF1A48|nr:C-type lectin domain family 3 member A-like [Neodiprion pinetum]
MAPMIAYTLPAMQLVCNLVIPQAPDLTRNNSDAKTQNAPVVNDSLILELDASTTSIPPVTASLPKIEAKTLPDGYKSFPEIGAAFKLHEELATFPAANKKCIEEGGTLAVTDSWTKYDIVLQLLPPFLDYRVGITRMYESEDWVDIRTGSPLSTIPWRRGEPSGRYMCLDITRSFRGLWNFNCSEEMGFVCEIQVPQSDE